MNRQLLLFGASWCAPCKALKVLLDEMTAPYSFKDIDEESELAVTYKIRNVPTLVVLDAENKEITRVYGVQSRARITELLC